MCRFIVFSKFGKYVSVFGVWLFVFCNGPVSGHAGAGIESIDVVKPLNTDRIGIETTVGYLSAEDAVHYDWWCHETVTQSDAVLTPQYTQNSEGGVVAAIVDLLQARDTDQGLYWTADGCDWTVSEGATGQQVKDVALSPTNASVGVFVSDNDDRISGIYRSTDAGRSWTPTDVQYADRQFRSLGFSRGESGAIWAAAIRHETMQAWVFRSLDDGVTWSEHEVEVPEGSDPFTYLDVLAVDASDPDTAWFVMGPYLDDRLLKTTDGGVSFQEVYAVDGDIIDGALDKWGGIWLVLSGNRIVYGAADGAFEEVDSVPMSLGVETDSDGVMLATRVFVEGGALARSTDGADFDVEQPFSSLRPLMHCADDSDYAEFCAPLWEGLESKIVKPETDTGIVEVDEHIDTADERSGGVKASGCCSSDAKYSSVGALFVFTLALGRRRR